MATLKRFCLWMLQHHYPAVLVALGLLLALPSLWVGLQLDDFTIRAAVQERGLIEGVSGNRWEPFTFLDGDPQRTRKVVDLGLLPWWTDPECRLAFWRPLTAVTHMLDYRVWPDWPWLMHLQSLVWFALLIWATAVLYRRLIGRTHAAWIGALAALLFTLDDTHGLPAGWLANRNSLLAGLFGVLTLIAHDRWRRDGWRAGVLWAPLALSVGLLSKEATVCAGGYLLAYALFLDRGPWRSRLSSLLPYLAVGVVWFGVYRSLGFGAVGSGVYVDPAHDPIGFLYNVARRGPILLLGQWAFPPSGISLMWSTSAFLVHWLWALVLLTLVATALAPLVIRDRLARFWTLGMLLSVLPACIPFPMDRLLMFVGLGAMGLLALFLGGLKEADAWVPRHAAWRRPARVLAGLLVAIHLVLAPVLFSVMIQAPKLVGHEASRLMRTYPNDSRLPSQTMVVVNPMSLGVDWFLTLLRNDQGLPLPKRSFNLTTACSTASLTRIDDRTLSVRVDGGYLPPPGEWPDHPRPPLVSLVYGVRHFDRLVRGDRNPFELGETIELATATLTITELTADGRPAVIQFRFSVPLEDPSLRWMSVTHQSYESFRPPAVGETVEVALVP